MRGDIESRLTKLEAQHRDLAYFVKEIMAPRMIGTLNERLAKGFVEGMPENWASAPSSPAPCPECGGDKEVFRYDTRGFPQGCDPCPRCNHEKGEAHEEVAPARSDSARLPHGGSSGDAHSPIGGGTVSPPAPAVESEHEVGGPVLDPRPENGPDQGGGVPAPSPHLSPAPAGEPDAAHWKAAWEAAQASMGVVAAERDRLRADLAAAKERIKELEERPEIIHDIDDGQPRDAKDFILLKSELAAQDHEIEEARLQGYRNGLLDNSGGKIANLEHALNLANADLAARDQEIRDLEWEIWRPLQTGEMTRPTDQALDPDEDAKWEPNTAAAPRPAPDPRFPAHVHYRRRIVDDLRADLAAAKEDAERLTKAVQSAMQVADMFHYERKGKHINWATDSPKLEELSGWTAREKWIADQEATTALAVRELAKSDAIIVALSQALAVAREALERLASGKFVTTFMNPMDGVRNFTKEALARLEADHD